MPHVQIRNVPAEVHRKLKTRAVRAGMSLSQYLLEEIEKVAEVPTTDDLLRRVRRRSSIEPKESSAEIVRRIRNET